MDLSQSYIYIFTFMLTYSRFFPNTFNAIVQNTEILV